MYMQDVVMAFRSVFFFVGELFQSLKCQSTRQVFNPSGALVGKIFLGITSANHIFTGKGRMVILAETKIFLVNFRANSSLIDLV
jgi:hypothetical protein